MMKQTLYILGLILSNVSNAQISIQASAGMNHSFLYNYHYPQYFALGYQFGSLINVPIQNNFIFQSGIKYQTKKLKNINSKETNNQNGVIHTTSSGMSQNITQLSIPLILRYQFDMNQHLKNTISLGIQYNFTTSSYINSINKYEVSGTQFHKQSGSNKIYHKRSFSQITNLKDPNKAAVNLFIPSFIIEYEIGLKNKMSFTIFYEQSLYEHYLLNFYEFENFKWKTIGIKLSYPIFTAKSKALSNL